MVSQRISKSRLKAQMLAIFRDLQENGGEIIVTERDKPVLRIVPYTVKKSVEELFGDWRGSFRWNEDPDAPTTDEWDALK